MDKEELFAMAQEINTEEYCMLESDTSRVVVVPDRYKTFGVEGDTRVERIKFKFPKIVGDNIDLTTLNLRINFQNASGGLDKYVVDDVAEADDGYITFSWVIQDGVTPQSGQISFVVQAVKATEDGTIEKKWSTTLNKIGQVLEGLEVDETISQQNPDILESILTRLDELEKYGGGGSTPGKDGREVELQNSGTAIQWRYSGESDWKDLVQLSEITGKTATISVGNVTTGEAGTQASVQNTGTESDAVFDFTIPRGTDGNDGITPNIQIGEVTTLEPGQQATASVAGSKENPLLNLGIPKGQDGAGGGSTEKEWKRFIDVTIEETVNSLTQEIGFEADEIMIFFYTPTFTEGISSMKMFDGDDIVHSKQLFQDNNWGDATREKYIRIHIKNISRWPEAHEYLSNNKTIAPSMINEKYNVDMPYETEEDQKKANSIYMLASKGILQGSIIKAYAR